MDAEKRKDIIEALKLLCVEVYKNTLPQDELRKRVQNGLNYMHLLKSSESDLNEFKMVENIKKRFWHENKKEQCNRFVQLWSRVQESNMDRRVEILRFLVCVHSQRKNKLEKSSNSSAPPSLESKRTDASSSNSTSEMPPIAQQQMKRPVDLVGQGKLKVTETRTTIKTTTEELLVVPPRTNGVEEAQMGTALAARNAYAPDSVQTPDSLLLRDVIFCLQGIDGQYIRYNRTQESFYIVDTAVVANPKRELLLRITEIGWLHNRIRDYCNAVGQEARGLFAQAFRSGLQSELAEYYKYLALMQGQIDITYRKHPDSGSASPTAMVTGIQQMSKDAMTARRLYMAMTQWKRKLMYLVTILDKCKDSHGGMFLSRLYACSEHGDQEYVRTVLTLLRVTCRPLLNMLCAWILDGNLDDPHGEFFVKSSNEMFKEDAELWRGKYGLVEEAVPCFLARDLAEKVLMAGKAIYFIRTVLRVQADSDVLETKRKEAKEYDASILYDIDQRRPLARLITCALDESSCRLVNYLNELFQVDEHLNGIKKYLLLCQGDFARHLMDLLQPELNRPAAEVQFHKLSMILETTIHRTNAKFESRHVLDRLEVDTAAEIDGVDPQAAMAKASGWDIFSLKYRNDGPLSMVITDECLRVYTQLFHFVWRLKRLSFNLADLWHRSMAETKFLDTYAADLTREFLHKFQIPAREMSHFVDCMQYYFFYEVFECDWHRFREQIRARGSKLNLDELMQLHEQYLAKLLRKSFLSDSDHSRSAMSRLECVLELIFDFVAVCNHLLDTTQAEAERRRDYKLKMPKSMETAEFRRKEEEKRRHTLKQFKTTFGSKLDLVDKFRASLHAFLLSLIDRSDEEDELKALCLRLDYSGYYQRNDSKLDDSFKLGAKFE